jgi:hypothetical protein
MARPAALLVAVLLLGIAAPAAASRVALDSRSLPFLLASDPSLIRVLPAEAAGRAAEVLADDDLGLALGGRGLRYGYLLDGTTHNLFLAGRSSWGVVLGFTDRFQKEEDGSKTALYHSESEALNWEHSARLGFGWAVADAGGRTFELGVTGKFIQGEISAEAYRSEEEGETTDLRLQSKVRHGLGADIVLRTLTSSAGLLLAVRGTYDDLRPEAADSVTLHGKRKAVGFDAGYRVKGLGTDDLVFGVSGSWSETSTADVSSGSAVSAASLTGTLWQGTGFISGEHELRPDLVARGGLRGSIVRSESRKTQYVVDASGSSSDALVTTDVSLSDPVVVLGLGWRWRRITADIRMDSNLTVSSIVAAWAVRVVL